MVASARAAVREEERQKRAEPTTPAQDELRALLECVPPFDLLTASERSGGSATASEAAEAALRGADAATARAASASSGWAGADPEADPRTSLGGASLEASLRALRVCENTTLRSLQLAQEATKLNSLSSEYAIQYGFLLLKEARYEDAKVELGRALRLVEPKWKVAKQTHAGAWISQQQEQIRSLIEFAKKRNNVPILNGERKRAARMFG